MIISIVSVVPGLSSARCSTFKNFLLGLHYRLPVGTVHRYPPFQRLVFLCGPSSARVCTRLFPIYFPQFPEPIRVTLNETIIECTCLPANKTSTGLGLDAVKVEAILVNTLE